MGCICIRCCCISYRKHNSHCLPRSLSLSSPFYNPSSPALFTHKVRNFLFLKEQRSRGKNLEVGFAFICGWVSLFLSFFNLSLSLPISVSILSLRACSVSLCAGSYCWQYNSKQRDIKTGDRGSSEREQKLLMEDPSSLGLSLSLSIEWSLCGSVHG